jgi:hypothetical protein
MYASQPEAVGLAAGVSGPAGPAGPVGLVDSAGPAGPAGPAGLVGPAGPRVASAASPAARICGNPATGIDHDSKWTPPYSAFEPATAAGADQKDKCCPMRMNDSRMMTDFRTKCNRLFEGAPETAAASMSSYEYRKYLMEHASQLMEQNRADAEKRVNPCGLSVAPASASPSSAADLGGNGGLDGAMYAALPDAFGGGRA